jgi:hypothetical protein
MWPRKAEHEPDQRNRSAYVAGEDGKEIVYWRGQIWQGVYEIAISITPDGLQGIRIIAST